MLLYVYKVNTNEKREETEMVEIARIMTFGTANRRDIVRRLMGCSRFFMVWTLGDAFASSLYAEYTGVVVGGEVWVALYHDCDN